MEGVRREANAPGAGSVFASQDRSLEQQVLEPLIGPSEDFHCPGAGACAAAGSRSASFQVPEPSCRGSQLGRLPALIGRSKPASLSLLLLPHPLAPRRTLPACS